MKPRIKPTDDTASDVREDTQRPSAEAIATSVVWDDAAMTSSYANVINVINTREEFSLFFGLNQSWDAISERGLAVRLENRIVMSPYAVKRLHILLGERLTSYEQRFGPLNIAG